MGKKGRWVGTRLSMAFIVSLLLFVASGSIDSKRLRGRPVKIGYAISMSGVFASYGEDLRDGLNLYMDKIGHKAGGREIKILIEDIGSNQVNRALDIGRKLIQKNNIDILGRSYRHRFSLCLGRLGRETQDPFCHIQRRGRRSYPEKNQSLYYTRFLLQQRGFASPWGLGLRKGLSQGGGYGFGLRRRL